MAIRRQGLTKYVCPACHWAGDVVHTRAGLYGLTPYCPRCSTAVTTATQPAVARTRRSLGGPYVPGWLRAYDVTQGPAFPPVKRATK